MLIRNSTALEEKIKHAQSSVPKNILAEIREFVLSAKDAELVNINPYRLAKARNINQTQTLKALLHLTKAGLFNLFWTIHCPSRKSATQVSEKLLSLKHGSNCPFCSVSVEVSFAVNPPSSSRRRWIPSRCSRPSPTRSLESASTSTRGREGRGRGLRVSHRQQGFGQEAEDGCTIHKLAKAAM